MRNLIVIMLLSVLAAATEAACKQSDLAGRWEFLSNSLSCRYVLDEEGLIEKGGCWKHGIDTGGFAPLAESRFIGGMGDNPYTIGAEVPFRVNGHCRVDGGFTTGNVYVYLMIGRVDLNKSIVSGEAGYFFFQGGGIKEYASFSMVRY
jgi:hypothetical protein